MYLHIVSKVIGMMPTHWTRRILCFSSCITRQQIQYDGNNKYDFPIKFVLVVFTVYDCRVKCLHIGIRFQTPKVNQGLTVILASRILFFEI